MTDSGPLQGNGAGNSDMGRKKVVGAGGNVSGWSEGGGEGSRRGGGVGGRDGWISKGSSWKLRHGKM